MLVPRIHKIEKEVRWLSSDVREMCIRENLFTCGDCNAYDDMLTYVDTHEPTDETIYDVAYWIIAHSKTEHDINSLMFEIANNVVRTFYDCK